MDFIGMGRWSTNTSVALLCGGVAIVVAACGLDLKGSAEIASSSSGSSSGTTASSSGSSGLDGSTAGDGSSSSSSGGNLDDSGTTGDASLPDDGCISFANGIPAGFTHEGEFGATAETIANVGVKITLASAVRSNIFGTVTSPIGNYSTSEVTYSMDIEEGTGVWGVASIDYIPFLKNYHGANRNADQSSLVELTMAQNRYEVNVWTPEYSGHAITGSNVESVPSSTITTTVKWDTTANGLVQTKIGSINDSRTKKTLASGPTDKLTIVVGGRASNIVPEVRVVLKKICIKFQ